MGSMSDETLGWGGTSEQKTGAQQGAYIMLNTEMPARQCLAGWWKRPKFGQNCAILAQFWGKMAEKIPDRQKLPAPCLLSSGMASFSFWLGSFFPSSALVSVLLLSCPSPLGVVGGLSC